MRFPEITISGSPAARGWAYGAALASEIEATIDFYATVFQKPSDEIFARARYFRQKIAAYNPAYCVEIEAIAAGAKIKEPLWVYALNSRSEILGLEASQPPNECTVIAFPDAGLLGQTWDWSSRLESLTILLQIQLSADHSIQMLTEPGIIGKIGLNSYGIGVCLNILLMNKPLDGVPIHIVLRSILESKTIEAAKEAVQKAGYGKASNLLFGDQSGNFLDVEFAGDESFWLPTQGRYLAHTNHYLAQPINPRDDHFCNSYTRYDLATTEAALLNEFTPDALKTILSDRSHPYYPIWRPYQSDEVLIDVGTVATVVLDLKARQLHVRKGNRSAATDSPEFRLAFSG